MTDTDEYPEIDEIDSLPDETKPRRNIIDPFTRDFIADERYFITAVSVSVLAGAGAFYCIKERKWKWALRSLALSLASGYLAYYFFRQEMKSGEPWQPFS